HRASVSKQISSVNSRKLSESTREAFRVNGTNERPKQRLTSMSHTLHNRHNQIAAIRAQFLRAAALGRGLERIVQRNGIHMNSTPPFKLKHLMAALTVIVPVAVPSLARLAAQSAVTLPIKVDSDLSGISLELT